MAGKYKSNHSIKHLNGNILCAIDTETTGLECDYHEVVQVAFVPLTDDFKPDDSLEPFLCMIAPEYPNRWDPAAARVNGLKDIASKHGLDPLTALDQFIEWFHKLPLEETLSKPYKKRLIPLAKNWAFDYGFLNAWFGKTETNDPAIDMFIDRRCARDLQTAVHYMNDLAYMNAEPIPFPKTSLKSICGRINVPLNNAHDALADCYATAAAYAKVTNMRMPLGLDFGQVPFDMESVPDEYKITSEDVA